MSPATPLLWAVAAGSWGGAATNAALNGHWSFAALSFVGAFALACFAAYLQHRLVADLRRNPP